MTQSRSDNPVIQIKVKGLNLAIKRQILPFDLQIKAQLCTAHER